MVGCRHVGSAWQSVAGCSGRQRCLRLSTCKADLRIPCRCGTLSARCSCSEKQVCSCSEKQVCNCSEKQVCSCSEKQKAAVEQTCFALPCRSVVRSASGEAPVRAFASCSSAASTNPCAILSCASAVATDGFAALATLSCASASATALTAAFASAVLRSVTGM